LNTTLTRRQFDLIANVRFNEERIDLSVEYWASRIAGPVAKAQMAAFEDAVTFLLEGADLSVHDFPSHSSQDRAAFISWNSTKPARLESCVHDLVVNKMAEQPEALAVSSWDGELTYGELERASRRLAYYLVEKGVGPEVMVGMCMEKSKLGVVAMVATLLAGGGLVPLGVSHPLARIDGIVKDAASPLILVDRVHEERLAELGSYTELVAVDSFFDEAPSTAIPSSGPYTSVGPDNVAWMIFTSGSTGKPKGVVLEHGSLATSILYHGRRLDIQPYDRLLQFAAFTFDAAIQEIITALAFGATTCIPSEGDRMNRLSNYLAESKVTIATLTSTVAALVRPQETPTVRTIILMGEAVQAKVVDQWIEHATVINAYGPSECCIHSTCRPVTDSSASLNIGTAIAGATWVVNPTNIGQLVPLGGQGELLLEGPLLARGYLNDSVKTAQAFVTDPAFVRELGLGHGQHRMYRTGDLVQQNTDGTLTYLGRIDSQIKIRGQRVEIGEIEYHIGKQAGVRDAVVLYMRQGPLADRLVAAVNLGDSSSVDRPQTSAVQCVPEDQMENARLRLREVQHGLSRQVMHYMVPSIYLPLSAMPMNQSGKTDRRALTDWIQSLSSDEIAALSNGGGADDVDDTSATAVERELRQIWSEVLDVPLRSVTYSSSFFSLGGDSITAMQVVSASRSRGILITVRKVLDCQTIPELAAEAQATQDSDYAAIPEGAFALSPIQQMYFESIAADGLRADNEHCFNQGVLLHVTRQITLAELTRALNMAVAKHAMLRARFQYSQDQGWQQRIEREITGSYRLCTHTAGDAEMSEIVAQSQSTLDIEHGPVFAADLVEREDRQVLHLVAHHLVIDLVSWRILLRDLEEVIVNQKLPNPSSLSFPTWLERQRESVSKVANVLDTLPMIVPKTNWDYWGLTPGQEIFGSRSSTQARCDIETTSLLTGGANAPLKTEPVEILLASLLLSFQQVFTDRSVPAIFTEGHGREAPDDGTELSETIGWFTTMSPIHVSLGEFSSSSAIDVLRQVKDQRRRIPGRGVPYFGSRFLTAQGKEQFAGHGPAEIMFNYTGRFQQLERDDALFHFDRDNDSSTTSRAGSLVKLFAALDVAITIEAGELCITVHYSNQSRSQAAIRKWVEVYSQTVKSLVEELNTAEPVATATDFPLAHLSDSDMATIEGQYLPTIGLTSSAEIEDILPCSPIQQGILLTQLQSPSTYCIYQTCRIVPSGAAPVSVDRLIAAWREVVSRHSILRTVLLEPLQGQENFIQIVLRHPGIGILRKDDIADGATAAEWLASRPSLDVSILSRPPHLLTVLTTVSGEVYCRFDISHALVDASSVALIMRDLMGAYDGEKLQSPVGGSKYSTYVAFLQGRDSQDDLQYWTSLLQDAEPCLLPPKDPTHDTKEQATIKKVSTQIDDIGKLHQFRDKYGISIASIFQLSWALVLAMQTGSRNVSFGNLSSGRDVPITGVQELVGPMINMLVCHLDLNWGARVSEVARKLQSRSTEAFEHQRTSLAAIQHGLGLSRNQPLFNSTLSYKRQASTSSGRASAITLEGLTWEDPTEYDVHINIEASSTSIAINMQYSTAAFSEATTTKLVDSLVRAAIAVCDNGDRTLGQLRLLSPAEEAKLREWNSVIPPRVERCVHELVLDKMVSQPEALAISAWDGDFTYVELNHTSYHLAHHLVAERGIGPEVMIGLCMDKSKWAIVAMIAVLRAGGTLVPLGVQEPFSRIQTITRETGTPLVLVDRHHEQRLAELDDTHLFTVDSFFDTAPPIPEVLPSTELSPTRPDHAAWIIFTSGSTGKPKGVVLEHGSVATSILAHGPAIGIQTQDRVSQFAAYTFDVSIAEIMTTLTFGACVCVPSEDDRTNRLTHFLSESEVSIATLTSTVAALVQPDKTPTIRTLVLTGEAVQSKVVDQWIHRATVINAYGPAESSIWTTGKVIKSGLDATNIGKPLSGAFWVVNPDSVGQLVHIGELLIESPLLARGYLNDPTKTAASFITNPEFLENLGLDIGSRRMYRTGDLVQQNQDGTITYLGRRDTQVKIRGQRVEIGEIEYHLRQQAGMHDAVVLYMNQGALAGRLIAFIVSSDTLVAGHDQSQPQSNANIQRVPEEQNESADIWLKDIQQNLSQLVMHYMMPSVWIRLLAIPINASGKTDRLGLLRWVESLSTEETAALTGAGEIEGEDVDETSATRIERELRQIWSEVLDVPISRVTYSTNFFSLGGDSITAMQVVSACRARGILVTVRKVLDCQTIPELAANSHTGQQDAAHIARIPDGVFGLSPIQQMFFDEIAGDGLRADMDYRFNQAISLYTTQRVEKADLTWAMNALVSKHAMLRARFRHSQDNAWQQWVEKDITGSYRLQDHTVVDVEFMQHIIEKSQASLDLEHGPVFAVDFIERQDRQGRQVLHLVAHHLVVDLVSWRILIRDLEELLVHHKLPNPTSLSFPVWLERQQDSLNRLVNETEEGADKSLEETLPVVVPNTNWDYWGLVPGKDIYASLSTIEIKCDSATTSLLLGNANTARKTEPVDILLAALLISFQDVFTDRPMPAVFTEGHGRETEEEGIDLSDTVSWFTTIIPVHVPRGAAKNAIELLRQVKDQRRRLPGRGLPYFGSRYLTSRGRDKFASHGPAEIVFNYLGRFQQLEREDALFHIEDDDTSASSQFGPLVKLFSVLDVSVAVEAGGLSIKVRFSRESRHQSAIKQLVKVYADTVKTLVEELAITTPTLTATDFPLARLSDSDWELIEGQYLKTEMGLSSTKEVEDILPCSAIQQGILLTQLQSPSTYCIHQTCRILPTDHTRPVDIQRLIVAWHQVVARHSILRSVLVEPLPGQEKFLQIVLREPRIDVQIVDGEDIKDENAVEWLASQPTLDVTKLGRPPHRLIILKTNTANVYCRFDVSHALVDASSVALILRDLIAGYEGELGPSGGSNYSAYVAFLEGRQQHNDLQYWKSLLADAEPCLLSPQQPVHEASQAQLGHIVDRLDDLTKVHQFRDRYNVSIASICQLSWALVLANWTGSRNISFGNLSSGRDVPIPGVQELVGPMINMLVCHLCLDWNASTTIGDMARKLQNQSTEAFEHQRASLASIQHELGLSKDQPLFNSTISYRRQASTSPDSKPAAIRLEAVVSVDPTEYDVHVNIDASSTSLEFNLQYSTAVLSETAATRLAESLVQAVRIVSQNVDRPLRQLTGNLLPTGDKLQLQEWNSDVPLPVQRCVHELVSDQITTLPEALAVSSWDGDMTYNQLGETSRRLASYLVEQGVGPETMVGLCLDKSKWAIVAMLAVLFAGGAVVPLGVKHPVSRIRSIIQDTTAPIILVDDIHEKRLAAMTAHTQLLSVESFFQTSSPMSLQSGKSTARPEDPAWIIYTSGSSGIPKGVVLQHNALATSILAHGPAIGVQPSDRLSQFAAYTFDVSIAEIMTALSFGACVCVPSEQDRMERLPSFLNDAGITIATLTSTVAALIQEDIPTIRTLVLTGEAVQSKVVDQWRQQATVINAYGPSESSIWATCNIVQSGADALNIGKPLAGAFWVANPDNTGQLVVRGAPGELLIEGPLLAREYLNDPDKTSTSFVRDPVFMQELGLGPGRRLYRTGDLVQQNEDATLTYMGRIDTQIKIRGQRVEVAEIESQIVRLLPEAREAVVDLVRPEGEVHDGPLMLVAVIEHSDARPSLDGEVFSLDDTAQIPDAALEALGRLDDDLGNVLPPYMVPASFLLVSKLPVNASGKLDRRVVRQKLQSISRDTIVRFSGSRDSIKAAPTTDLERTLQTLYSTALELVPEAVGINDSFFKLGGDSVAAMKLTAVARAQNVSISVADIFRWPRLVDLSRVIEEKYSHDIEPLDKDPAPYSLWPDLKETQIKTQTDAHNDSTRQARSLEDIATQCDISADQIEDVYPCSPMQAGLMVITAQRPEAYVIQRVFKLHDDLSTQQLKAAWARLTEKLSILRTRIIPSASAQADALQVVIQEAPVWQECKSLEDYLATDRATPITYGRALSRTAIVDDAAGRYFVWTVHHSVYDGWSVARTMEMLTQLLSGQSTFSPAPVSRFINYLVRQDKDQIAGFWNRHFEGANWVRYPAITSPQYQAKPRDTLLSQIHVNLETGGPATMSTLLRAAWALLVATNTGANDAAINVVLSGRMAPIDGVMDIISPLVTTVPFYVSASREQSVRVFLETVHHRATEMIPYEHTGLQNIRAIVPGLGSEFDPGHTFVVQPAGESESASLPMFKMDVDRDATSLDAFDAYALTVECTVGGQNPGDVTIELRYDRAVLAVDIAQHLIAQFAHIVQQLAQNAETEKPLSELQLLTQEDRAQLREWNSVVPPRLERCLHGLILETMTSHPTAPAISSWDGEMTYGELNDASQCLAYHLVNQGIGPEVMVGLCMDKSRWAVVAVLAILRAGGVVVPLGIQQPLLRIEGIIQETSSPLILVDRSQEHRLTSLSERASLFAVDSFFNAAPAPWTKMHNLSTKPLPSVKPDHSAYVIFTSGSTGVPKGIVLEHGALATSIIAHGTEFGMDIKARDRVLQFAAYTFDVAIQDIIATFSFGACLCIPSEHDRMNRLVPYISEAKVTLAILTPTVATLIQPQDVPSLRTLILGGEALPAKVSNLISSLFNALSNLPHRLSING
jgi:amino acid adenylation domain-containing protein/non-ribosomal peptide synthase protein (TIGR01720 family)